MEVVIFCGGKGTRLWPHTENGNKHMIEIGGRPILWHLMKIYSSNGFKDFVLCLGKYGGDIWEYFSKKENIEENWKIKFVNTGDETPKAGRLAKVKKFVKGENFFVTYGDGVSDVNIKDLFNFHKKHGKIATLTAVRVPNQYGILDIDDKDEYYTINSFREKPRLDYWLNGGFFVFNKKIFDYLDKDKDLEREVLKKIAEEGELSAYKHNGFWKSMDTFKDVIQLNELWEDSAPWAIWEKSN
ncbi:MAG: NTP transferase domain-containing protein [Candidatus Aenigmarchaeota archaeon]|nr:NTP transferase domain-containing protein [Candidatus Aenigmarchaeota archaeon]